MSLSEGRCNGGKWWKVASLRSNNISNEKSNLRAKIMRCWQQYQRCVARGYVPFPIPENVLQVLPGPCLPWFIHELEKSSPEIQCSQRNVPGSEKFRFFELFLGVGSQTIQRHTDLRRTGYTFAAGCNPGMSISGMSLGSANEPDPCGRRWYRKLSGPTQGALRLGW